MDTQQIIMGVLRFLHDLFTVVWVGGLTFLVLTMIPSLKEVFGKSQQVQSMTNVITRHQRVWVYVSIVGLLVTGLLLGKSNAAYKGFMNFENLYSSLTSIKHILTFAMVSVALFRSIYFGRKDIVLNPGTNKFGILLIMVNFIFGLLVLLLSGFIASI